MRWGVTKFKLTLSAKLWMNSTIWKINFHARSCTVRVSFWVELRIWANQHHYLLSPGAECEGSKAEGSDSTTCWSFFSPISGFLAGHFGYHVLLAGTLAHGKSFEGGSASGWRVTTDLVGHKSNFILKRTKSLWNVKEMVMMIWDESSRRVFLEREERASLWFHFGVRAGSNIVTGWQMTERGQHCQMIGYIVAMIHHLPGRLFFPNPIASSFCVSPN